MVLSMAGFSVGLDAFWVLGLLCPEIPLLCVLCWGSALWGVVFDYLGIGRLVSSSCGDALGADRGFQTGYRILSRFNLKVCLLCGSHGCCHCVRNSHHKFEDLAPENA